MKIVIGVTPAQAGVQVGPEAAGLRLPRDCGPPKEMKIVIGVTPAQAGVQVGPEAAGLRLLRE